MLRLRPTLLVAIALSATLAASAGAQSPTRGGPLSLRPTAPSHRTLYRQGPDGRYLMDGTWLFRFDRGQGRRRHFERARGTAGWTALTVPNAWNATDQSEASMNGTSAWYRKDFKLPPGGSSATWLVRFESVNYRSQVWLNGHALGSHAGAYLPFEFELKHAYLHRGGAVNHLVIRVDNRRHPTDFPPSGLTAQGTPTGGWWNYGGLLREVYLRRVNRVDLESVQVLPTLPCATCGAHLRYRVVVHNYANSTQRVHLTSRFGSRALSLGTATIAGHSSRTVHASASLPHPVLWWPASPHLYDITLDAAAGGSRLAHWFLRSGVRSIRVLQGRLMLNGQFLNFRGVGLHEDSKQFGFAIDNSIRDRFVSEIKDIGATLVRAHYPLHPYFEEQADANGILLWSEIPVYSVKTQYLAHPSVRNHGVAELQHNILTNSNHPSVIVWSIGNELSSKPGPDQAAYISSAARAAHRLDPTRPVGLAIAAYPSAGCHPRAYAPLNILGFNDYFGWYPGPEGDIADRDLLSGFLDTVRGCYPSQAIAVTEYGAEANRPGPVEERGTFAFQQSYVNFNLDLFATKSWVAGAVYWGLEEFRVRPHWDGGDPRPNPPIHEKGLITFTGQRKPAYFDVQRQYRGTTQLHP
ncbi:MAG TPA: glycoside hydrolase family 2 TIM barrel-domain containing protein [Solirubrobacteraceae bacterium]|jgi:beta-glucuronidase|nr:glycoside hydrolase family 2 TIM barrel-domain containing protein [Solirubrobacteraceae bacterium]